VTAIVPKSAWLLPALALIVVLVWALKPRSPATPAPNSPTPATTNDSPPVSGPIEKIESPPDLETQVETTSMSKAGAPLPSGTHGNLGPAPDDESLLAATWDEFYKLARHPGVRTRQDRFELLILRRLELEGGLTAAESSRTQRVLTDEQMEVTTVISKDYGGPEKLKEAMLSQARVGGHSIWKELKARRDVIRAANDAKYLQFLTLDQLALVNEHLRNAEISLATGKIDGKVQPMIRGVGK
jgi:hypothetical protein